MLSSSVPQILEDMGYEPEKDFSWGQGENGDYELSWLNKDQEDPYYPDGPSFQEIDNHRLAWSQNTAIEDLRKSCTARILIHWDQHEQQNVALGIYSAETCAQCKTDIEAMLTEYHRAKALILAAEDPTAVDAATASITWPLPETA